MENKYCVEFGAWDGIHFSNTWNLWHNKNWGALLIEADHDKYKVLQQTTRDYNQVRLLNAFVTIEGPNSLNQILFNAKVPIDFDLLSIDIDSDDYYIFKNLSEFRPRLVLVEYNPTIPPHLNIVQNPGEYFGCSALALYNLGKLKNYVLVHMTDTNMFFLRSEDFVKLDVNVPDFEMLFPKQHLTNVITSYGGQPFISKIPVYMKQLDKEKYAASNENIPKTISVDLELIPISIRRISDKD